MLTLVSLYTLHTLVYSVYPCLPKSFCILADNSCQDYYIPYTYRRTPLGLEPVVSDWIKSVFSHQQNPAVYRQKHIQKHIMLLV